MVTYVALLRSINVGGHSKVGMEDLRRLFLALGLTDVKTYLQSGNVTSGVMSTSHRGWLGTSRSALLGALRMAIRVLLRTKDDLAQVVTNNPFRNRELDPSKLPVTFLTDTPDPKRIALPETLIGEPDEFALVGRDVYLHFRNDYGRTKLNNAYIERRLDVVATTRSRSTVTKLCDLTSG